MTVATSASAVAASIRMPAQAVLLKWHKAMGDRVDGGDLVAEVETEKTVVELYAEASGVLGAHQVQEGTRDVAEGTVIAEILAGDAASAAAPAIATATAPATAPVQAAPPVAAPPPAPRVAAVAAPVSRAAPVAPAVPTQPAVAGARRFASPLARKTAAEAGVSIDSIAGSGPGGRIVERDVRARIAAQGAVPQFAAVAPVAHGELPVGVEAVPLDGMRAAIARRLTLSKQTVPHFYLNASIEVDALLALRESLNRSSPVSEGGKAAFRLSVNDFIVKALALALQRVPAANTVWDGDRLLRHRASDVGVAVAVEGGLFTPVVRDADRKSLQAISSEVRDFAARAATRRLMPAEYEGGTSSVSNLGMYGVESFAAILNPPQSTILAVGAAAPCVVVRQGVPHVAQRMNVTLSCDHRVVDGAIGAQLLSQFKSLIESPNVLRARSTRLDPA